MKKPIKRKNPSDTLFSDLNQMIATLEDVKHYSRGPEAIPNDTALRELRKAVKEIDKLSEKILVKLVKRINDLE